MNEFAAMGNVLVGLVLWAMAVGGVILWTCCAGARLGEGCEPEHDCSNCGHCPETGLSEACQHCVEFYPVTPDWVPVLDAADSETESKEEAA